MYLREGVAKDASELLVSTLFLHKHIPVGPQGTGRPDETMDKMDNLYSHVYPLIIELSTYHDELTKAFNKHCVSKK